MAGMPLSKLSGPVQSLSGYAVFEVSSRALPEGLDIKTETAGIAPQVLGFKQEQLFRLTSPPCASRPKLKT